MKLPGAYTLVAGLRSSESITGTEKAMRQLTLPDLIAAFPLIPVWKYHSLL